MMKALVEMISKAVAADQGQDQGQDLDQNQGQDPENAVAEEIIS